MFALVLLSLANPAHACTSTTVTDAYGVSHTVMNRLDVIVDPNTPSGSVVPGAIDVLLLQARARSTDSTCGGVSIDDIEFGYDAEDKAYTKWPANILTVNVIRRPVGVVVGTLAKDTCSGTSPLFDCLFAGLSASIPVNVGATLRLAMNVDTTRASTMQDDTITGYTVSITWSDMLGETMEELFSLTGETLQF